MLALMVCVVVFGTMMPVSASALEKGVYTASVVTSYYNPDTGEVDDGGTANAALGEGMCRSATGTTALVEYDGKNTWVTIRLLLQSNCKNVALYTRNGYNSYSKVNYTVMAEDAGEDSIDYRFKVSDAGVKMKGTMYVTPMGRDVVWYLYLNTGSLKKGSGNFVVSIDTSSSAPASTTPASSGKTTTASASGATNRTTSAGSSTGTSSAGSSSAGDTSKSDDGKTGENSDASDDEKSDENGTDTENIDENTDENAGGDELNNEDSADPEDEDVSPDSISDEDEAKSGEYGGFSGVAVAAVIIVVLAVVAGAAVFYIRRKK